MELAIDRLTKQYKNKIAVDRVSLKLKPGVYGLLGANEAGKTTLMRMKKTKSKDIFWRNETKTIRKIRFILFNISYNIRNNFVCTYEF